MNLKQNLLGASALVAALLAFGSPASAKELVFWSMWNETEPQAQALKQAMDLYTKAHPDVTFKAVWNGRQNQTKLRGALQAGTAVDFMDQDGDQLAGGMQKEGLGLDVSGDLADVKGNFMPGILDLFATDGHVFQVPYVYNTVNFWYGADMMKEMGAAAPASFDDLLGLCKVVADKGKHALVAESNVAFYNVLYFAHYLERANGSGAVVKAFEDKTGAGWKDPAVLAAAQSAKALWDAGCFSEDSRAFQYPAGQQTIALGETLGELVGSWLPTELAATAGKDFKWGAFNFPSVKDGKGKVTDLEVGPLSFMVLKSSVNAKEAVDFIKFATGPEAQKIMVDVGGVGVTNKTVAWPDNIQAAHDSAMTATALSPFGGGLGVQYADFTSTVFEPEYNKLFLGQQTAEQFVETLSAKTKEYWEKKK